MKKHKHQCTRTKPLHTPCRCRCGAERVTRNAYGVEMPRTGGRWKRQRVATNSRRGETMYRIERQHEGPTRGHWLPVKGAT